MSRIASPELLKKPCIKCGAVERDRWGKCKPCKADRHHKWCKANVAKLAVYRRKWRKANPEKEAEYRHKYHQANIEKDADRHRKWRKTNAEKLAAYWRKYYKANQKKLVEYSRQWKKANPVKTATHRASRRARVSGNGGTFTAAEWLALLTHYKHTCLCCGRNDARLYADHVISISNGGTSDISNIQPLCQYCNTSKGTKNTDFRPNSGIEFVYTRPRQLELFIDKVL